MLCAVKDAAWRVLAWGLGWAATRIRRRPSGHDPAAWRAVHLSYAHFGEDLIILLLLGGGFAQRRGCYVDVGAFDPVLHSNTFLLYLHGWRGLNIDASPHRVARFAAARPGDTNVMAVLSDDARDVLFLEYPTAGTSRVAPADDPVRTNAAGEHPTTITPCRTQTLSELLKRYRPEVAIDFLNIDCEGLDLAVLQGLDWSRWVPRVIAVEANTTTDREKIVGYLAERQYGLVSQHLVTLVFLHASARDGLPPGLWPAAAEGSTR